jgi:hypothetical protein
MLVYDKKHNGEWQTYIGQYYPTPSSLVSLVAFTPREKFRTNVSQMKQTLLGFSPQRNPVAIADDTKWKLTTL